MNEKTLASGKCPRKKLGAKRARVSHFSAAIFRLPMFFRYSLDGLSWEGGTARSLHVGTKYHMLFPKILFDLKVQELR